MLPPASPLTTLGWVLAGHRGRAGARGRGPTVLGSNGLSPKAFAHILLSNPTPYILLLIVQRDGVSFLPSPSLGCAEIFGDLPVAVSCIHALRESIVPLMASSEMLRCLVKLMVKTACWWPHRPQADSMASSAFG